MPPGAASVLPKSPLSRDDRNNPPEDADAKLDIVTDHADGVGTLSVESKDKPVASTKGGEVHQETKSVSKTSNEFDNHSKNDRSLCSERVDVDIDENLTAFPIKSSNGGERKGHRVRPVVQTKPVFTSLATPSSETRRTRSRNPSTPVLVSPSNNSPQASRSTGPKETPPYDTAKPLLRNLSTTSASAIMTEKVTGLPPRAAKDLESVSTPSLPGDGEPEARLHSLPSNLKEYDLYSDCTAEHVQTNPHPGRDCVIDEGVLSDALNISDRSESTTATSTAVSRSQSNETRISHTTEDSRDHKRNQSASCIIKFNDVGSILEPVEDLDVEDKDGNPPLTRAVLAKDEMKSIQLIHQGANIHHKNVCGETALHLAARLGVQRIVKILVEKGADINCRSLAQETPLFYSIFENRLETIKFLINLGADLKAEPFGGSTPLSWAVGNNLEEVVDMILREDVNIHHVDKAGRTALHCASEIGIVKRLLNAGMDVNHRNHCGQSYLNVACRCQIWPVVNYLLSPEIKVKVDLNSTDNDGDSPLMWASYHGEVSIVKALLSNGANCTLVNKEGKTARDVAKDRGHTEIVELLPKKEPCSESVAQRKKLMLERDFLLHSQSGGILSILGMAMLIRDIDVNMREASVGATPLLMCAEWENSEGVSLLLEAGANVNMADAGGDTPLMKAISSGSTKIVKALLVAGANIDERNCCGDSPFILSASCGEKEIFDILCSLESDINSVNKKGESALMLAAKSSCVAVVKELLAKGACVNTRSKYKETALFRSLEADEMETAEFLLKAETSKDCRRPDGMLTLHYLAQMNYSKIDDLLSLKVDVNVSDRRGMTALMYASVNEYDDNGIVCKLLERKADVNKRRQDGKTALHLAVLENNPSIVETLMESGARSDLTDPVSMIDRLKAFIGTNDIISRPTPEPRTPLHLAVLSGNKIMVETLARCGARLDLCDTKGRSVLMMAADKGDTNLMTYFIAWNVKINSQDSKGWTPLMFSAQHGFIEAMEVLTTQGALIDKKTEAGDTTLAICAANGLEKAVRYLLEKGADVNSRNTDGYTPLHLATYNGHLEAVKALLEHKPRLDYADSKHLNTALHTAVEKGFKGIAFCIIMENLELNRKNRKAQTPLHLSSFHGHCTIMNQLVRLGADLEVLDQNGNTALMLSVHQKHSAIAKTLISAGAQTAVKNKQNKTALQLGVGSESAECVDLLLKTGRHSHSDIEQAKQEAQKLNHDTISDVLSRYSKDDEMTGTLAKTGDRANDDDLLGDRVKVVVDKCSQKFYRNHRADSYQMERNPRGLALIVNVYEAKGRKPRRGTNFDRDNLRDLLTQLYFDVTIYNDTDGLSAGEITAKVREFSTDPRHARSDACIVCMLSHGDEGHIAGNDGGKVELSEIFAMFNNNNCKYLIGKPKLFIIQACRGRLAESVVRTVEADDSSEDIEEPEDLVSTSDVLKCFPTQALYRSFRDPRKGSWFIEAIVKVFMEYAKSEDVCAMMNRVNSIISKKVGELKWRTKYGTIMEGKLMQMSEYYSTLTKPHLYFFPGISSPNSS